MDPKVDGVTVSLTTTTKVEKKTVSYPDAIDRWLRETGFIRTPTILIQRGDSLMVNGRLWMVLTLNRDSIELIPVVGREHLDFVAPTDPNLR